MNEWLQHGTNESGTGTAPYGPKNGRYLTSVRLSAESHKGREVPVE